MASVTATVKLTNFLLSEVDELVKKGIFTSRSEVIREAVRLMVLSQYGMLKGKSKKQQLTESDRAKNFKRFLKEKGLN